jgi:hypothetical protein
MRVYDFEVLKDGAIIAAKQTIALPDTSAAWPKVAELTKSFDDRVTKSVFRDEAGGIVILIGVATLRRCANARSSGVLQHLHVGASGIIPKSR